MTQHDARTFFLRHCKNPSRPLTSSTREGLLTHMMQVIFLGGREEKRDQNPVPNRCQIEEIFAPVSKLHAGVK